MMSAVRPHHPKYRTKLCRNFSNGSCPFGQKCTFLHPAPGINPLSSSVAQYLFNWNMLLPQLLALQQGTLKKMPQSLPPRPQGPQLVDEDPSPPASLLLSTSDSTSSERMPQKRRYNKRKKQPCGQFAWTGGWCQAGEKCKLNHDVAALSSAEGGKAQHTAPFETGVHRDGGRSVIGVLMGGQVPSPPVISQEYPVPPRYTEAESAEPYHAFHWPGYAWHSFQQNYPSVPPTAAVRVPATMVPPPTVQHNTYHPLQPSVQSVPPNETQTSLPLGAYEVNGTTYFPTQMPPASAPPMPCSVPIHPAPYNQTMPLVYPYYAPPPMPVNYYDIQNQRMNIPPPASFDPLSSDSLMPHELPVIPRLEDYQISPIQHDNRSHLLSLPSILPGDLGSTNTTDQPKGTHEHEFPYQPPREQQVGHARRISINIKKEGRASCG